MFYGSAHLDRESTDLPLYSAALCTALECGTQSESLAPAAATSPSGRCEESTL